jgi:hypothetical protein
MGERPHFSHRNPQSPPGAMPDLGTGCEAITLAYPAQVAS